MLVNHNFHDYLISFIFKCKEDYLTLLEFQITFCLSNLKPDNNKYDENERLTLIPYC